MSLNDLRNLETKENVRVYYKQQVKEKPLTFGVNVASGTNV